MTWSYHLLRGGDDLEIRPFEPVTSSGTLIVETVGETGYIDSLTVQRKLAEGSAPFGIRLMEGREVQKYDVDSTSWVSDTPQTTFGPLLVRELNITEHPDRPDTWRVDFVATGMGPLLNDSSEVIGSPNIAVSTVSRPRNVSAWREGATVPTDTISSGAFTKSVWRTGTDIGGDAIDINTTPVSIAIDQTVVQIQKIMRWPYQDWNADWRYGSTGSTTAGTVDLDGLELYVGARNTEAFLGFPIGTLYWQSVEFQPHHHEFRLVTLTFVYDPWKHAQQVPLVLEQFATPTDTDPTTGMSQAKTVLWNQVYFDPFTLNGSNYSTWFSDAEWDYLDDVFN
jgi:hypothetical protein